MFGIGVPELILILVVGLIVFGPGKLPEMGRSLGKGIREFRKASRAACGAARTDGTGDDGSTRGSTDTYGNTDRGYRSGGRRGAQGRAEYI